MEEEKIIIYDEENNYDTVITENTDEIVYDETIQIVEIDEPKLFTVDTNEAFTSLGGQNEQLNHALLHNRDLPDQHIIGSITGLREELDYIESLKTVESDKRGSANYYEWTEDQLAVPDDKIGYFVSIHTKDHKIRKCDNKSEIFGVTVDSAGFVGWQEDRSRDDKCALVANTGVVKVKCDPDIVSGNYVMSNKYGEATRSDNGKYGYRVISIDTIGDQRYAIISLDSTMNQVYALSTDVETFNKRIDSVEIRANAAINTASEAFKNSVDAAIQASKDALNSANSALDKVTNLEDGFTSEIDRVQVQIDAINDCVIAESQAAAREAVDELIEDAVNSNQKVEDLQEQISDTREYLDQSRDEIERISKDIQPLIDFENGSYIGVDGVTNSLVTISKYLSNDYETIDTWETASGKNKGQIYYVKDEKSYYYYDTETQQWLLTFDPTEAGLSEAIASVRQRVDEDEAMLESLTSYAGEQYETIPIWNWYDTTDNWAEKIYTADPHIIYYDTITKLYWQCDLDSEPPWSSSEVSPRDDFEEKDVAKVYYAEDTKRYYYYDYGWHSTVSSTAKLAQSIALTKQTADANSAKIEEILSYSGPDSDTLASIRASVEENRADIDLLTSYVENNYEKCDVPWDEVSNDKKELTSNIYYAKDSDGVWKYWYWKTELPTPQWVGSPNPSDAGLVASIASVQQQATDNEASITALQSWQGETNDALAELRAFADESGAGMESLVMNISKYTVGKYSQAYGLTVAEAKELLRDGTVFVPNEDTSESYEKEDKTYVTRPFSKKFHYTWNKDLGVWSVGDAESVVFTDKYIIGGDGTEYIVIEDNYEGSYEEISSKSEVTDTTLSVMYYVVDESKYYYYHQGTWYPAQDPNFEIGALYYWNTDKENPYWQKVATTESNTLNRAISQMRQSVTDTAVEFTNNLADVKGNLSGLTQRVDIVESSYVTTAKFDENMSQIEQKADANGARLNLLVSTSIQTIDDWDVTERTEEDKDTVFYVTSEEEYYYWNETGWASTNDVNNSSLASKINSAGIITAINNNGDSSLKISAQHIDITGTDIDMSGYVTISDLSGEDTTTIDGSNIKTGIIESQNYKEEQNKTTQGMSINLFDGEIKTKNFSIDSDGDASFVGDISGGTISIGDTNNLPAFYVDKDGNVIVRGNMTFANTSTVTWTQLSALDNAIDDTNARMNEFTRVENGKTMINGNSIVTGTIDAGDINAGTISSWTIESAEINGATIDSGTINIYDIYGGDLHTKINSTGLYQTNNGDTIGGLAVIEAPTAKALEGNATTNQNLIDSFFSFLDDIFGDPSGTITTPSDTDNIRHYQALYFNESNSDGVFIGRMTNNGFKPNLGCESNDVVVYNELKVNGKAGIHAKDNGGTYKRLIGRSTADATDLCVGGANENGDLYLYANETVHFKLNIKNTHGVSIGVNTKYPYIKFTCDGQDQYLFMDTNLNLYFGALSPDIAKPIVGGW